MRSSNTSPALSGCASTRLKSWFRKGRIWDWLFGPSSVPPSRARRFRPQLEILEERRVPSITFSGPASISNNLGDNVKEVLPVSASSDDPDSTVTVSVISGLPQSIQYSDGLLQGQITAAPGAYTVTVQATESQYVPGAFRYEEYGKIYSAPGTWKVIDTEMTTFEWDIDAASKTTIASSANPSALGESITLTAAVTSTPGFFAPSSGTVTFTDGSTVLATNPIQANGTSQFTSSTLSPGLHNITATYNPSTSFWKSSTSPPVAQVIQDQVSLNESTDRAYETIGTPVSFEVSLAAPSNQDITVDYATSDGSAIAGVNYEPANGTLTIPAGQTSATFSLTILNDNAMGDYPGTVNIALSNPSSYGILGSPTSGVFNIDDLTWINGPQFQWSQTPPPPPAIDPPDQFSAEGQQISLPVTASGSGQLNFSAVNLPGGLSINSSSGVISGTINYQAAEVFGGIYPATVIVSDANGSATDSFTWTVSDTPRPPTVSNPGAQSSSAGSSVSLQIQASQPDGDPLQYSAAGLPNGLSIDNNSGIISGQIDPSAGSAAPYSVTVTAIDSTLATPMSASQTFTWTVTAPVPSVVIQPINNQTNAVGDSVDLVPTASDGAGLPLTFTATGLPQGFAIDPATGEIAGTIATAAASPNPANVTVLASDGSASASTNFTWQISGITVQNPGSQTAIDSESFSLQIAATGTSPTDTLTYSASGLPSGLSVNNADGLISGTVATGADVGSPYTVTVTVSDSVYSTVQTFNLSVSRLALTAAGNQSSVEGASVTLPTAFTDDAGTPSFSAAGLPPGLGINQSTGLIFGQISKGAFAQSPYQVTITATDGASVQQSFVWSVTPEIALANPGPQSNAGGDPVNLSLFAFDRSGGNLTYSQQGLPAGLGINAAGVITGTVSTTAISGSPYIVTVTASDGVYQNSQTFSWTVGGIQLPSPGDQTNLDGDSPTLSMAASYHGSGTLTYSANGLPPGLGINSATGVISGSITSDADQYGPYAVTVTATDGIASSSQTFSWDVNQRIALTPVGDQMNLTTSSVQLQLNAIDNASNSPAITYGATGLPSGVHIDTASGLISGTISEPVSGTPDVVTITASDGTVTVSQNFFWTVTGVTLANPGPQIDVAGASAQLQLSTQSAPGSSITYTAFGLPTGLFLNQATGLISGTPAPSDNNMAFDVSVQATSANSTATQTFVWQIASVVLTSPGDQTTTEGNSLTLPISAQAVSGSLNYSAAGLPNGVAINASTGVISGSPTSGTAAAGPYTVTVSASNGTFSDSQTFNWTVDPRIAITPINNQPITEQNPVAILVAASEPGATLTYNATGLPPGLSINQMTGQITGSPSAGDAANSPYTTVITVSDGNYSDNINATWNVAANNAPPTLMNPGTQSNQVGDGIDLQLSATDPNRYPLTFSAVGLPDGVFLDPNSGLISGSIPDDDLSDGPQTTTVTATASDGQSASQTFIWLINDSVITLLPAAFTAEEGVDTGNILLANVAVSSSEWTSYEFGASINWGDGTTDVGVVDGSSGTFTVSDGHIYDHPGIYTVQIAFTDGYQTVNASCTATVTPAPITVQGGYQQGLTANTSSIATWASFSDTNPDEPASSYTATIDWGDGTQSDGMVAGMGGQFTVSGSHAYSANGRNSVTITISDSDGTQSTGTSTAVVGDLVAGWLGDLTVSSFVSSNPNATASDFKAMVDWGDGTAPDSNAQISQINDGQFLVMGSHTYQRDSFDRANGAYKVIVTVDGPQYEFITTTKQVTVVRPIETIMGDQFSGQATIPITNIPVATFVDPNLHDSESEFSATINWGDTGTSNGTVQNMGGGTYIVLGTHTYNTDGEFPVNVQVSQGWGSLALAINSIVAVSIGEAPTTKSNVQYSFGTDEVPSSLKDGNVGYKDVVIDLKYPKTETRGYLLQGVKDNIIGINATTGRVEPASTIRIDQVAQTGTEGGLADNWSYKLTKKAEKNYIISFDVSTVTTGYSYLKADPRRKSAAPTYKPLLDGEGDPLNGASVSEDNLNYVINGMRPNTKGSQTVYYLYYNASLAQAKKLAQKDILAAITKENATLGGQLETFLNDNKLALGATSFEILVIGSGGNRPTLKSDFTP